MTPPDNTADIGLAARLVRTFLDAHQLPRHRQATWLSRNLGIAHTTALRRLTGRIGWNLDDLNALAQAMGSTLSELLRGILDEGAVPACLITGSLHQASQLWLGEAISPQHPPAAGLFIATPCSASTHAHLTATRTPMARSSPPLWQVLPMAENVPLVKAHHVRRMLIDNPGTAPLRIAVLDDQGPMAATLAMSLTPAGFNAQAFTTASSLACALRQQQKTRKSPADRPQTGTSHGRISRHAPGAIHHQ